jgi:hypothetical protein
MLLVVACTLVVLIIGSAEAGKHECPKGYKDCDHKWHNKCETWVEGNDVYNCGDCYHKCKPEWGEYSEAYCYYGDCKNRCKYGYEYDKHKHRCVKKHDKHGH